MSPLAAQQCAVILVNYNSAQDTLACLCAVYALKNQPAHIVVTDNGSRPEALQDLLQGWELLCQTTGYALPVVVSTDRPLGSASAVLLVLPENTGFSGGNNAALRLLLAHTNCTALWLLNNDTEPTPDALDALCARLNAQPSAALCGSALVYASQPDVLQCAGGSALSPLTGRTHFLAGGFAATSVCSLNVLTIERSMSYITGASLLVCREVFEKIGILPEEYFLYYEDAAFCLAAKRAGFKLAWAPQSSVYHKEGGSSGATSGRGQHAPQRSRFVDYLSLRNRVFLMRSYYPWALPLVAVSYVGVIIQRIRRGQVDRICLVCRAFWHGFTGKMGKPQENI